MDVITKPGELYTLIEPNGVKRALLSFPDSGFLPAINVTDSDYTPLHSKPAKRAHRLRRNWRHILSVWGLSLAAVAVLCASLAFVLSVLSQGGVIL